MGHNAVLAIKASSVRIKKKFGQNAVSAIKTAV